jgi:hypothetical protein
MSCVEFWELSDISINIAIAILILVNLQFSSVSHYFFTEPRGRVVNTPASYFGDLGFKSRL